MLLGLHSWIAGGGGVDGELGTWQHQYTTDCNLAGHNCWVLGTVSRRTHHAINDSAKEAVRALMLSLRSHTTICTLCMGVVWDEDSQGDCYASSLERGLWRSSRASSRLVLLLQAPMIHWPLSWWSPSTRLLCLIACTTYSLLCRGVVWDEDNQRWAVCLSPEEGAVEKQLGLFQSEEAAASAYDTLAIELWGPSTPTNFRPQGVKSAREDAEI